MYVISSCLCVLIHGVILYKYLYLCLQDECSFVSLRDVERAMIVFEYFLDKMHILGPKIDGKNGAKFADKAIGLVSQEDSEDEDVEEMVLGSESASDDIDDEVVQVC